MPEAPKFELSIPGRAPLCLKHLVLDYNGTMACDGQLLPELIPQLNALAQQLTVHVLTADTHGTVANHVTSLPVKLVVIPPNNQTQAKQEYIHQLGCAHCIAIGNGINDELMLHDAAIGIAIMHHEGVALSTLQGADIAINSCHCALELLLKPTRLIATLRC
ncbi:MAG: ATPase P [Desulfobacteraceae bacterium 4572_35.1]|nr:MAG: ATPase P [Desulfobacteraceae bacterium 4572_35.1]